MKGCHLVVQVHTMLARLAEREREAKEPKRRLEPVRKKLELRQKP